MSCSTTCCTQFDIHNLLPSSFPQVASGISIHVHGFYMWGQDVWADGVGYLTQCPIPSGSRYRYSFQVMTRYRDNL